MALAHYRITIVYNVLARGEHARMRRKPGGSACKRKRRMNSGASRVIVLCAAGVCNPCISKATWPSLSEQPLVGDRDALRMAPGRAPGGNQISGGAEAPPLAAQHVEQAGETAWRSGLWTFGANTGFRDAESGWRHSSGAVFQAGMFVEEQQQLFRAEDDGQLVRAGISSVLSTGTSPPRCCERIFSA